MRAGTEKPQRAFWKLLAVFTTLAALAFVLGLWVSGSYFRAFQDRNELIWDQTLGLQATGTGHALRESVRLLRERAQAGVLSGGIVHWAEIEWESGIPGVRRSVRHPAFEAEFTPPMEKTFISAALRRLDGSRMKRLESGGNGSDVFRFRRDPLQSAEWLAFLFPAKPPLRVKGAVLILVDPVEAFPVYAQKDGDKPEVQTRKYLLTSEGRALSHSLSAYVGADFAVSEVFREIQARAGGEGESSGVFSSVRSLDQQRVSVAFWKPEGLPVISVVERVTDTTHPDWRRVFGASLIAAGLLISAIGGGIWLMLKTEIVAV